MKNILLLTDFSDNSLNAIDYALRLFNNEVCDFYVLNVQKALTYSSDDLMMVKPNETLYESLILENKERLNNIIEKLKQNSNSKLHTFKSIIDYDVFIDSIKQVVSKYNIEFIVMGTNGASNATEVIFGSNALKVLRHVNCNTLVVPNDYKYKKLEKLQLALDSDDYIDHVTVRDIIDLMQKLNVNIDIYRFMSLEDNLQSKISLDKELLLELIDENRFTYTALSGKSLSNILVDNDILDQNAIITLVGQFKGFFERLFGDASKTKISKNLKSPLIIFHH